ncbi:MAG: murein biosynthesis integral membrane protein MurJ [Desulfobacterales bacterium]
MTQSVYRKIGAASLIMMASIFLSRFMGLFREMAIAAVGGADTAVDAYRVAFVLPEILNHILASGFLSVTFIPIFSRYLSAGDESGGREVFSVILTVFGTLLAVLVVISMILAPQLVALLAPGRDDLVFQAMAVRMTRIILPAQLFFFAGGLFSAVQYARERFAVPALAPLIYNLGIIGGGVLLGPRLGMEGFAWGVLGGALVGNFLVQWIGARRTGLRVKILFVLNHPDLIRYMALTLPLMLGLTMTFSTEIFSKLFGSYLPAGAISWIDYAWRIMLMLVAFFGQAVGVAVYPFMARFAAEERLEEVNVLFNTILRYMALIIPVSALVWVLRMEIVQLIYERGRFTPVDTQMTAGVLATLLIGAFAFSVQTVVNRGFYARQNTLLPSIYSTVAVLASLPIYWFGMKILGLAGIGVAISFSAVIQVVLLYEVWNRKTRNTGRGDVYRFYGRIALATLPIGLGLSLLHSVLVRWIDPGTVSGSLLVTACLGTAFGILLLLSARMMKIREVDHLTARLCSRFQKKTGKESG